MFYDFKQKQENPYFSDVTDVTPNEVNENAANLALIDVREEHEFTGELGHVPNSKLISMGGIPEALPDLPKDKTIVFICRSGSRSAQVSAYAKQEGFTEVYNMLGGMLMWNQLLLPVER